MFQISFFRLAFQLRWSCIFIFSPLTFDISIHSRRNWFGMRLWRLFKNHFFLCQSSVLITTRCFCRRTTVLKKGAQGYECCPSVGPSEGFLCLGLPVAEICAFYFLCICFQTIYSSEFHKLRTTLTNNLFHHDHANKISSCWSWIPTSFFPNFENVP